MRPRRSLHLLAAGFVVVFALVAGLAVECRRRPIGEAQAAAPSPVVGSVRLEAAAPSRRPAAVGPGPSGAVTPPADDEAGSALVGMVVDEAGQPAANVEVVASAVPGQPAAGEAPDEVTARSNREGRFALDLPAGEYALTAYREGAPGDAVSEVIEPLHLAPRERLDGLVLHLGRGADLRGAVVRTDGSPVQGVELCARLHATAKSCAAVATSDEKGEFALTNVPPRALFVHATSDDDDDLVIPARAPQRGLRLVLPLAPAISGQVVDSTGRPVEDAEVIWRRRDDSHRAGTVSDGDGRFTLTLASSWGRVEGELWARHPEIGYAPVRPSVADGRPLRLQLLAGATLTGRAVDADGLPTITALVVDRDGAEVEQVRTNRLGTFSLLQLPPGRYTIADPARRVKVAVEIGAPGEYRAPDLRLAGVRRLRGRVVDHLGRPRGGVVIRAIDVESHGAPQRLGRSAADGTFELARPVSGTVAVFADLGDREPMPTIVQPSDQPLQEIELRLAEAPELQLLRHGHGE